MVRTQNSGFEYHRDAVGAFLIPKIEKEEYIYGNSTSNSYNRVNILDIPT